MIELPDWAVPNGAVPALIDFGGVLRPALGGPLQRIDRMGSRYRVALTFAPFGDARQGAIVVSRLIRAKREGLRVEYPLPGTQGIPGTPVVNGGGQAGLAIALRGLTPGYAALEGYWLSIVAPGGRHYLHNVAGTVVAGSNGQAVVPLSEMLRRPFPDGASVRLAKPMIEGLIDGNEQQWSLSVEHDVEIEMAIEEAA